MSPSVMRVGSLIKKFGVGRARLIKNGTRVCDVVGSRKQERMMASPKKFMRGLMECEME